ncbi:MAG: hypothetical protein IPP12_05995 [Nitrospira sp.]|nr:hypothetical protein [Nitrospira sp.]MBK9946724.1 hypothetical protein [Nitrospira sp.]MBL8053035.1 hypothetical protein [Nitrospira sp.]
MSALSFSLNQLVLFGGAAPASHRVGCVCRFDRITAMRGGKITSISRRTRIIIVGGSAGGTSAAARARRRDESAHIVVLGRGSHAGFANRGLP